MNTKRTYIYRKNGAEPEEKTVIKSLKYIKKEFKENCVNAGAVDFNYKFLDNKLSNNI